MIKFLWIPLFFWAGAVGGAEEELPGLANQAVTGKLEEIGGRPLLYLWGTPKERGYAEGYLLAEEIVGTLNDFWLGPHLFPDPKWWDAMVIPRVKRRIEVRDATLARFEGMLAGIRARLEPAERSLQRLGREITSVDLLAGIAMPDHAGLRCSSFVATGALVEAGSNPLVGRNLDYGSTQIMLDNFMLKVEAKTEAADAWLSLSYPGLVGCLTGYSEAGFSLAIHDVPAPGAASTKVTPRIEALGAVMDQRYEPAGIQESVAGILRSYRFAFGGNAMLAWNLDGKVGACVFELDGNRDNDLGVSLRPLNADGFLVCTNHFRIRRTQSSCRRYDTLVIGCEMVRDMESDLLTFEAAWSLLCRASVSETLYRSLYDPEAGRLRVQPRATVGGAMGSAYEVALSEVFARCRELAGAAGSLKSAVETR